MSQGANNGPSQAAGNNQFVKFSRGAAQRIAKVVRIVEAGDRNEPAVQFEHVHSGLKLKLATFTGNWETAQWKTVTLSGTTSTASVYNWCNAALGGDTSSTTKTRIVVFGKVHGTNSVLEIQMRPTQCTATFTLGGLDVTQLPGYESGVIQLLGHAAVSTNNTCSGGLTWYSVTTCTTSTAA